jgi:hypothetical protein
LPARRPSAAVDEFVARLRQVAACITDQPLLSTGHRPAPQPHFVSFVPLDLPVPLRSRRGGRGAELFVRIDYTVDALAPGSGYEVRSSAYRYHVLDAHGRELLAYHWHPEGVSPVVSPHVHVSNAAWLLPGPPDPSAAPPTLAGIHLPTGPVALADVVRLLIAEFAVVPRRADWETVLRQHRDVPSIPE